MDAASNGEVLIGPLEDEPLKVGWEGTESQGQSLKVDRAEDRVIPLELANKPPFVLTAIEGGAEVEIPSLENEVVVGISKMDLGGRKEWGRHIR